MFKHTFPKRAIKVGNSWAITIPAQYIEDGSIDPDREIYIGLGQVEVPRG